MGGKGSGPRSTYSEAAAKHIIAGLSRGQPLARICRDKGMPHRVTVDRWRAENADFAQRYARAREDGFDVLAAGCLDIADAEDRPDADTARDKLRVDTRMRLLRCWDPSRYGDKTQTELTGPGGGAVQFERIERTIVDPYDSDR